MVPQYRDDRGGGDGGDEMFPLERDDEAVTERGGNF